MPSLTIPERLEPLLQPNRYKVLYGGRGSAKSWSIASVLVHMATMRPMRILCARETQKSIQESVHRLIKDTIGRLGVEALFDVQETRILGRNGSDFAFTGIRQQSVANLKSFEAVDICWVEEAQIVTKRSWDVLVPTIRKPGSEIWISFNPELDTDETYSRFVLDPPEGAWVCRLNWHDNPWFGAELEAERLLMQRRDPIGYRTIWEGECRPAVEGAIYAQEIDLLQRQGRYTTVSHDPLLKTHTVWDLGWNDQTVILLMQRAASELRIIGCRISRFATYEDDVQGLRDMAATMPGLQWGTDWLPHDARATSKLAGGKTPEDIVRALGRNVEIVPSDSIENGIKLVRSIFGRLWVDKSAMDWFNAVKRYHRHISSDGDKTGQPVHDDASHGADALRYLAIVAERLHNHSTQWPQIQYQTRRVA